MLYQIIIPPILIIPLLMSTKCNHSDSNQTDVYTTYSNHDEAKDDRPRIEPKPEAKAEIQILMPEKYLDNTPNFATQSNKKSETEEDSSEVVFVPNEKAIVRNEEYLARNPIRVGDILERKTVDDAMAAGPVRVETEAPNEIIFMSGKNNQHENTRDTKKHKHETHGDTRRSESRTAIDRSPKGRLDCSNLDCNNTVQSVCGMKVERSQWKYRLFLNECFFRKVNCYFTNVMNRYHLVPKEKCQNVGVHVPRPEYWYPYNAFQYSYPVFKGGKGKSEKVNNTRPNIPSRRSMSVQLDGRTCAHACPVACPADYNPECAESGTGTRKVFENHCKLDFSSCTFGIVWYRRPLSACVGNKVADLRQNRGFIDWMQRVGIVDKKGKLVLS